MTPDVVHISLPGDRPPWTSTGLRVEAGDTVTLLGSGFIRWSEGRDVGAGSKFHLWGRVPGGEIFGCTQDTATVTVDRTGELELCVYKGVWADRSGALATGDGPYRRNHGALDVAVLRWPAGTDPVEGLERLDDPTLDQGLVDAERERLRHPITQPPGWTHLVDFGTTDIFRAAQVDARPAIEIVCADDAGIIQKPVSLALDPTTTFEWRWRVDALPSTTAEDSTWTHDHLSVAVEFDSGRDLTWFWIAALKPVEGTFDCPVRGWTHRETHMPVRSGVEGIGQFHRERRIVWEDHRRFMGEPPTAIVAVWLIAVSHFSRATGRATFADLTLTTGDQVVHLL